MANGQDRPPVATEPIVEAGTTPAEPGTGWHARSVMGLLPLSACLLALGLTCGFIFLDQKHTDHVAQSNFEKRVEGLRFGLESELDHVQSILGISRGLFDGDPRVTLRDWDIFTASLDFDESLGALRQLIYIQTDRSQLAPAEGEVMLPVRFRAGSSDGPKVLFPLSFNIARIGDFDRLAYQAAVTGRPLLSQIFTLDFLNTNGQFLFLAQGVYAGGGIPVTTNERLKRLKGLLVAVIDGEALLQRVLEPGDGSYVGAVQMAIEDAAGSGQLLFGPHWRQLEADSSPLMTNLVIDPFDRSWILRFMATQSFADSFTSDQSLVIALVGGLISILVGLVAHMLVTGKMRAERLASTLSQQSRQNEERARAAESRLLDAIESIPDGFAIWDAEDRLVLTNARYLQMLPELASVLKPGVSYDEVLDFAVRERIYPESRGQERHWRNRRKQEHRSPGAPQDRSLAGGRWQRITERPTKEGGIVSLRADISQAKQAELELRKLSATVQASPAVVLMTDPSGRLEYVNPRFTELTGYEPEEVLGSAPSVLKSGRMAPEVYAELWRTITNGRVWRGELLNQKKSGELFWADTAIAPIRDDRGHIVHYVAVHEDITERKNAEKAVFERLNVEQALADLSRDFVRADATDLDRVLQESLAKVGRLLGADRVFVLIAGTESSMLVYAHEWYAAGIAANQASFPGIHTDTMPWMMERLRRFDTINVSDVATLSERAANEARLAEARGVQSLLMAPLIVDGSLGGALGLEAVQAQKVWDGNALGILNLISEILSGALQRRQSESRLRESEQRYRQLFLGNRAPALLIDPDGQAIRDANNAAARYYGFRRDALIGMSFDDFTVEIPDEAAAHGHLEGSALDLQKDDEDGGQMIRRQRLASGEIRDVEIHAGPVVIDNRALVYAIVHDITERKRAEERIRHMASHDGLTGLPNRAMGMDRLQTAMARCKRFGTHCGLLFVDLDGFKAVNDQMGHDSGDDLLRTVANRLVESVRETDTVSRFGGDEFTILLADMSRKEDAALVAGNILARIAEPFGPGLEGAKVGASIGIALYPVDGSAAEDLVKAADDAMYAVKQSGKNHFRFAGGPVGDAAE
ncbi:MAG: diguanylate cyclase domain-containing protein [Magnetovibrionaceae bacterium]